MLYSMDNEDLTETEESVRSFMLSYQGIFNKAPTLGEIHHACHSIEWRSSARYVLTRLHTKGYIDIVAPTNCGRRFRAREAS